MEENSVIQKAKAWFGLLLSMVFIAIGAAMLSGSIFSEHAVFNQGIRIIVGLALTGYGIVRGVLIYRKIAWGRKGAEDT